MSIVDSCQDAREALHGRFISLQSEGMLSSKQKFTPVCVSIGTKVQPNRKRMFCLNRSGRRALPGLVEEYAEVVTGSSSVPEVVRRQRRWVQKEK